MKLNKILNIAVFSLMTAFVCSCGINYVDVSDSPGYPDVPVEPGTVNGNMRDYPVWGTVTDTSGNPLAGVKVVSGECVDLTDEAGFFHLERVDDNGNRPIVRFEKEGFFPVVRSCYIDNSNNYGWQVALASLSNASATAELFDSSAPINISVGGMSLDLPADGFVVAATGKKYRGTVEAEVFYLSPETDYFISLMPGGDLAAIDASNQTKVLLSYGMMSVELSDNDGHRLQLAGGEKAVVSFPTPKTMAYDAPASIPLWSFDESTGLWKEEGVARKDGMGNYVGEVGHFSWWNIDEPGDEAWIEGYVKNESGTPLSDIKIVFNNQYSTVTDATGYYRKRVQANDQFKVWIPSEEYGYYTPEYKKAVGPIASGSVLPHDIILPNVYYVKGRVIDEHNDPFVTSYLMKVPGMRSNWKNTDKNGEFMFYLRPGFTGEASVSVFNHKGEAENYEFNVPGNNNVYLEIKMGSGTIVPDVPDIIANCGGGNIKYLNASRPTSSTLGGVIIENSCLTVFSDAEALEEMDDMFLLQIPEYSSSKDEYDKFIFQAVDRGKTVICQSGSLKVTQNGDIYFFSLSGEGAYAEMNEDGDITGASKAYITVNNVDMPHFMTVERQENYTPKAPFKTFVPQLSTPAPVAMVVTKSEKLGTGGFLYYNGNMSDFDNLIAQAERTGYTQKYYNRTTDSGDAEYEEGSSAITIEADVNLPKISSSSWRGMSMFSFEIDDDDSDDYAYAFESQLYVSMLDGGTLSAGSITDYDITNARLNNCRFVDRRGILCKSLFRTIRDFYPSLIKE